MLFCHLWSITIKIVVLRTFQVFSTGIYKPCWRARAQFRPSTVKQWTFVRVYQKLKSFKCTFKINLAIHNRNLITTPFVTYDHQCRKFKGQNIKLWTKQSPTLCGSFRSKKIFSRTRSFASDHIWVMGPKLPGCAPVPVSYCRCVYCTVPVPPLSLGPAGISLFILHTSEEQ